MGKIHKNLQTLAKSPQIFLILKLTFFASFYFFFLFQAYVAIARKLGTRWLKRNIQLWCEHLLGLACKSSLSIGSTTSLPSSSLSFSSTNDQLLTIRRCLHYIFRLTIGTLLSEPDQITACKRLGIVLAEYNNCFGIYISFF